MDFAEIETGGVTFGAGIGGYLLEMGLHDVACWISFELNKSPR